MLYVSAPPSTTAVHRSQLSAVRVCAPLNDCCTQVSTQCCTCLRPPQRLLYTGLNSVLYVSAPPSTTAVHRSQLSAVRVCAPLNDCCTQVSNSVLYVSAPPSTTAVHRSRPSAVCVCAPLILTEVVSDSTTAVHRSQTQCCTCLRPPQRLLYTGLNSVLYVSAPPSTTAVHRSQLSAVRVCAPLNDCCTQVSTQCCTCLRPPQRLLYTGLNSVLYVSAPPSTTAVHRSQLSAVRVCAPPPQRLLYTGHDPVLYVSAPP